MGAPLSAVGGHRNLPDPLSRGRTPEKHCNYQPPYYPMKTFVINLPHATARRERVRTILAEHPRSTSEFIEAVDGRKLSAEEIERRFDLRKG